MGLLEKGILLLSNDDICELISSHHFDVQAKFDANNLAFTTDYLPLHTDLNYYDYVPGVS